MKALVTCVYNINEFFLLQGTESTIQEFKNFRDKVDNYCTNYQNNLATNIQDFKIEQEGNTQPNQNLIEEITSNRGNFDNIYKLYKLVLSFNNNPQINKWGRAIILNITSDSLTTTFLKLFFVDYGNIEVINLADIKVFTGSEIPHDIYLHPQSVIPCSLSRSFIKENEDRSITQKFCDMVRLHNGNLDLKINMHSTGRYYYISLFIPNVYGSTNMEDANPDAFSLAHLLNIPNEDQNLMQFKRELVINTFKGIQTPIIIA